MTEELEALVMNVINGNITDAKRQAKRFEEWEIREAFIEHGYSDRKAALGGAWLKGCPCWQAFCDAN